MAPCMYTAHIEVRQETVSSSEVYRTIHSDFMLLKMKALNFNTTVMQRSPRTQWLRFLRVINRFRVSASVS